MNYFDFTNRALHQKETCVGFLLGGIGEADEEKKLTNFMVVDKKTPVSDIEDTFASFLKRKEIEIILITQSIAENIRHLIDEHTDAIPAILEIPSKDSPYDPSKDSILQRAKGMIDLDD